MTVVRVHVTTELDAMRAIVSALETLDGDPDARGRVLRWMADRYAGTQPPVGPPPADPATRATS